MEPLEHLRSWARVPGATCCISAWLLGLDRRGTLGTLGTLEQVALTLIFASRASTSRGITVCLLAEDVWFEVVDTFSANAWQSATGLQLPVRRPIDEAVLHQYLR